MRARFQLSHITQEQIVLAVTALLFIGLSIFLEGFLSTGNLLSLLRSVSVLGILSLGMAIVVIGRGLDLSQIGVMAIGSGWVALLMSDGMATWKAVLFGLLAALAVGVVNGLVVAFVELPPLFATLASGMLVYGLGRAYVLSQSIIYVADERTGYLAMGQSLWLAVPVPVWIFIGLAMLAHLSLSRTSPGRFLYALGDNYDTARLSGVPVRPLTVLTYTLSAGIAFLGGLVLSAEVASVNTQMFNGTMVYDVVLVVVLGGISLLGGRGGVFSVLVGTLLIGVVINGMTILNFDNNVQNIVKSAVLLAAIIIDNQLHPRDEETARQGDI